MIIIKCVRSHFIMSSKNAYYAVAVGHQPGIYETWSETNENVHHYPGAVYKGFPTHEAAEEYLQSYHEKQVAAKAASSASATAPLSKLNTLTHEQRAVINHLLQGENLFLTGGGGVGKSYLLSVIYTEFPELKKRLNEINHPNRVAKHPRIQMCALTGCASLLLGHKTKTLHSWAGIGLGKGTIGELHVKIRRNTKAMRHWLCTDLLIIDEISMMTGELLDKLNELGKKIRSNSKPFGGIQLLLVGDFFQLPPVSKKDEPVQFAFESNAWKEGISGTIELTIIQRQKDEAFQTILKEARIGSLSKESCAILEKCQGKNWRDQKIRPTLLFPRRAEVEMINDTNLKALTGRRYHYHARLVYDGKIPKGFTEEDEGFKRALSQFDSEASYSLDLELAINAQVMLIANTDPESGLVNGSRGVVVGFCPSTDLPIVEFVNGIRKPVGCHTWAIEEYEFVSRSQVPLRLAYALTIHKSQGSSVDSALVDIGSGNFEFGQAYVALSRLRSLEALYVYDFTPSAFKTHSKVKEFYKQLIKKQVNENDPHLAMWEKLMEPADQVEMKSVVSGVSPPVYSVQVHKEDADEKVEEVEEEVEDSKDNLVMEPGTNWLYDSVPSEWRDHLSSCQPKLLELSSVLATKEFLPPREQIWSSLEYTPIHSIKVVILGQDPYPTPGNAHGLAFSVLPTIQPIPASLKNIYKELKSDIGCAIPTHGHLDQWAKQGIMLLNTVLTVEAGNPQSHSKLGWEEVTDQILRYIASTTEKVIFVLWGKSAQVKKKLLASYLDSHHHRIFESAHPSPLSASKGFFGSRPFSTINTWLTEMGKEPIQWEL